MWIRAWTRRERDQDQQAAREGRNVRIEKGGSLQPEIAQQHKKPPAARGVAKSAVLVDEKRGHLNKRGGLFAPTWHFS